MTWSIKEPWSDDRFLDGKEYRLAKRHLVVGVATVALCGVVGVVSTVVAALNLDGSFLYPVSTAIVAGGVWFGFGLLGGSLILAYRRERLFVSSRVVRTVGCFRTRELQLPDVGRAVWKTHGRGGGLVLHNHTGKVVIYLTSFRADEQLELIQFFRTALSEGIQEGWERFKRRWIGRSIAY